MKSELTDLSAEGDWDPARLAVEAFQWPVDPDRFALVTLAEVVRVVTPDSWAGDGTAVITPTSLDPVHGGIQKRSTKYQGAAYTVTHAGRGLHPFDLLVPTSPDIPALLVSTHLNGSTVSGRFLALRPVGGTAHWLWGVLNSQHGREARAHAAGMKHGLCRSSLALLDVEIPWPTREEADELDSRIARVELATRRPEETPAETWWRVTDLSAEGWHVALAIPGPERVDAGVPLGVLCQEIVSGRLERQLVESEPLPGLRPVADIGSLSGKGTSRWADPEAKGAAIVEPGDVLVASVGNRPYATVATAPAVLHENVVALRLVNPSLGPAIARYLNGQGGFGFRQAYLTGSTVPHLNKTNLRKIPVAHSALAPSRPVEPLVPLAQQLEQLLWT